VVEADGEVQYRAPDRRRERMDPDLRRLLA